MEWQAWFSLGLTVSVLAALVLLPRLSADAALMAALILLCLTGILTPDEALAGFSNHGLITVAAMFVVAAGIKSAGGVDMIVNGVLGQPKGPRRALLRMMMPVALLSGFMNNTPVVATMIPAVSQWARKIRQPTSALMIPLSYASILGGTLTIIGTSTNLVVNGQYQALTGAAGFDLFSITPIGVAVLLAGLVFVVVVAPLLLTERRSPDQTFADARQFTFEVAVATDGPLVGKSIQAAGLRNLQKIFLAEIERDDRIIGAVNPQEVLRGGDRLVFVGETDAIVDVLRINGLVPAVGSQPSLERKLPERNLIEAVVAPQCEAIGRTIRAARFRDRYGAVVLAVARNGEHIRGRLSSIIVQPGDVLLLETSSGGATGRLRNSRDFLLINELNHELPDHSRAWLSWGILAGIVALAASGVLSMLNASLLGAGLMVLSRCLRVGDARRSLDLAVLITIAASFALGVALEKTGAANMIAYSLTSLAGNNPFVLLVVTYFSVMLLTEMITNNAAAMLMLPVVLAIAEQSGLNQAPFVIAVMFAASASFATPLGYQCNLMVYGPGGYRFSDFLKIGIPMNLLVAAITLTLLPLFYPLS